MLTVAGGILEENGMVLIAQRKRDDDYGLKWELSSWRSCASRSR
jgi:hypothetical protein